MNIQHMLPQLFGVEKGKKLSMILILLILMYYSYACRKNLWKSPGFEVVVLFVLWNSVSIRSVFPLEKSLCTEKQRASIPEITGDTGVMSCFD